MRESRIRWQTWQKKNECRIFCHCNESLYLNAYSHHQRLHALISSYRLFVWSLFSLKQHFDIKSLSYLIALVVKTKKSHTSQLDKTNFLNSFEVELLANLHAQLNIPIDQPSGVVGGQSASISLRLRLDQWTACLQEDQTNFWTLGNYLVLSLL